METQVIRVIKTKKKTFIILKGLISRPTFSQHFLLGIMSTIYPVSLEFFFFLTSSIKESRTRDQNGDVSSPQFLFLPEVGHFLQDTRDRVTSHEPLRTHIHISIECRIAKRHAGAANQQTILFFQ